MSEKTENLVRLKGFVKTTPVIRYFSETNVKAYFSLVTYDLYQNQTEVKRIPEYHNIVAWKEIALKIEKEVKAGQFVSVQGRLKTNRYEKDGQERLSVQIVIDTFEIIEDIAEPKPAQYPPSIESPELDSLSDDLLSKHDEDDLPF